MSKKLKILTISDHPLSPSGVGTQSRYVCESLLKTGKYQIISLGGALIHGDNRPMKFHEYGDDWVLFPIQGYGNQDLIRSAIRTHKPDILWFMTDPRFFTWLWEIENEIRSLVPILYYHVWDNYPYPKFNRLFYQSTDYIATISKVTSDIVRTVAPNVEECYLPHSVNTNIFKRLSEDKRMALRNENFPEEKDKMIFFWNNRNARRKQSGTLIWWFKEFLDIIGHDKAMLLMHTDPKDENGQDLNAIINELGLTNRQVLISQNKLPPEYMAGLYSAVDCTINISNAEGFGLATFESLACETPIIVTLTGGLQEQVVNMKNIAMSQKYVDERNICDNKIIKCDHGIGIVPSSCSVIGSQLVHFIYEDVISKNDFINALIKFYNSSKEEKLEWGKKGREYILENYNFENFAAKWDEIITHVHDKHGSWENRKLYKSWELKTF